MVPVSCGAAVLARLAVWLALSPCRWLSQCLRWLSSPVYSFLHASVPPIPLVSLCLNPFPPDRVSPCCPGLTATQHLGHQVRGHRRHRSAALPRLTVIRPSLRPPVEATVGPSHETQSRKLLPRLHLGPGQSRHLHGHLPSRPHHPDICPSLGPTRRPERFKTYIASRPSAAGDGPGFPVALRLNAPHS